MRGGHARGEAGWVGGREAVVQGGHAREGAGAGGMSLRRELEAVRANWVYTLRAPNATRRPHGHLSEQVARHLSPKLTGKETAVHPTPALLAFLFAAANPRPTPTRTNAKAVRVTQVSWATFVKLAVIRVRAVIGYLARGPHDQTPTIRCLTKRSRTRAITGGLSSPTSVHFRPRSGRLAATPTGGYTNHSKPAAAWQPCRGR
jgi:hypothetical protein